MTIETALYDRLSNFAGLTSLVSTRIYPVQAPQSVTDPFVTYFLVTAAPVGALAADTDIEMPRFQVSGWSLSFDTAKSVGDQIKAALKRYNGTNDSVVIIDSVYLNRVDLHDPETDYYQDALDFEIWHRV